jgi:pimeloyl-ACP methyl ester carboxylesterase
MHRDSFVLSNRLGEKIVGDVRYYESGGRKPVVVILHSFMAFKDWGWFPYIAEKIAEAGFVSVVFNFSRSGIGEDFNRITEFEAFQRNTISHELGDTNVVLDAIKKGDIGEGIVGPGSIILLGHSRGGGEAIITAAERRDVKGLVTWSSVASFDRWTPHQKARWRQVGYFPLARDSSISPLRLGLELLDDVEKNKKKLDIVEAASRVWQPWLLIHGTEDLMVKFREAERLYAAANKSSVEFVPLQAVGHLYGGAKVTASSSIHAVIGHTIHWLKKHFYKDQKERLWLTQK